MLFQVAAVLRNAKGPARAKQRPTFKDALVRYAAPSKRTGMSAAELIVLEAADWERYTQLPQPTPF